MVRTSRRAGGTSSDPPRVVITRGAQGQKIKSTGAFEFTQVHREGSGFGALRFYQFLTSCQYGKGDQIHPYQNVTPLKRTSAWGTWPSLAQERVLSSAGTLSLRDGFPKGSSQLSHSTRHLRDMGTSSLESEKLR